MDHDKICNFESGHSIDASYQVLVYLAERFQRRILRCEKLTDGGGQVMGKVHIAFLQGEQKRTNNELQNITQKTKGLAARTPLSTVVK